VEEVFQDSTLGVAEVAEATEEEVDQEEVDMVVEAALVEVDVEKNQKMALVVDNRELL
jgi:hypothetical protein